MSFINAVKVVISALFFDENIQKSNENLDAPGPAYTLRGHEKSSMVISLASLGDNLISGGSDGKLLVWSLQSGSKIQLGNKSESPVNQCVYVNMKQICSGDANGRLQIFKHKKE